jgi:hypothetical protein
MGAWRVEQHYGVGVANVRLCAEPYLHPERRYSLREGIEALRDDLHANDRSLRRTLGVLPVLLLTVMVMLSFVLTVVRDRFDDSGIEMVVMASEPPVPVIPQEPVVEPPPPPEPKLVQQTRPPPPPPPQPVARPKPPPPKPVRLAEAPRVEPVRPPPPPRRVERPRAAPPRPSVQPRVQIDTLARAPVAPVATPVRVERAPAPDRAAPRPEVDIRPLAARAPIPDPATRPEPRRFAAVRPPPSSRGAAPDMAPVIAAVADVPAPSSTPPVHRGARAPAPTPTRGEVPRPALAAVASVPVSDRKAASALPTRTGVTARPSDRASAVPRPDLRVARMSQSAPAPAAPAAVSSRSTPAPRRAGSTGGTSLEPGLAGVPLGSLASCLSDRVEDALKQRVVAAVTTQEKCVSRAGVYRFVETKNLNSFLMWVDRAPTRKAGDRCDELRLALECLASQ